MRGNGPVHLRLRIAAADPPDGFPKGNQCLLPNLIQEDHPQLHEHEKQQQEARVELA